MNPVAAFYKLLAEAQEASESADHTDDSGQSNDVADKAAMELIKFIAENSDALVAGLASPADGDLVFDPIARHHLKNPKWVAPTC